MIYDPRRRALELRHRIIESMTAEELEEYAKSRDATIDDSSIVLPSDAELRKALDLDDEKRIDR